MKISPEDLQQLKDAFSLTNERSFTVQTIFSKKYGNFLHILLKFNGCPKGIKIKFTNNYAPTVEDITYTLRMCMVQAIGHGNLNVNFLAFFDHAGYVFNVRFNKRELK